MQPLPLTARHARRLWIAAQKLDLQAPFGKGPAAVARAVKHLGYVQIDTINVIERCHHHILFNRIPDYRRTDLKAAQSVDKSVFEYWTHALAYVATADLPYHLAIMRAGVAMKKWYEDLDPDDVKPVLRRIRREGPITIRDVDDEPVEKSHAWASRKPTKRLLQLGFVDGRLTISQRQGMVKSYELIDRHFGWPPRPRAATAGQVSEYLLERALRSQGVVSLDSVCYMDAPRKPAIKALIDRRVRAGQLVPVTIRGSEKVAHFAAPATLEARSGVVPDGVHILSPFDPLVIQRKRTRMIFDYEHVFEAYVSRAKRKLGYFTLPVLIGDEIVAGLDLKTDRTGRRLLIQAWHWFAAGRPRAHKKAIEEALDRFETFQLAE
ncbi:MAG TPA: crosslink repair DNA glycosylase YcaQ family protein [Candidatus Binatia bacterium]|nr:crosslink repair DNA glycosylase YcaQ family protein [Candidatus Binatia bacterium]